MFLRFLTAFLLCTTMSFAQDFSRDGLMQIKEHAETMRESWITAFDQSVQVKDLKALTPLRQQNEEFLDKYISSLRRQYASGDVRPLMTAVTNYLQISRQFVKDIMEDAETLNPSDEAGIEAIQQRIADFGQKERIFLVEINNALLSEPAPTGIAIQAEEQLMESEEDSFDEPQGSVIEGRRRSSKGRLPHEMYEEGEEEDGRRKKRKRR